VIEEGKMFARWSLQGLRGAREEEELFSFPLTPEGEQRCSKLIAIEGDKMFARWSLQGLRGAEGGGRNIHVSVITPNP
jgi:hypothetical protein